MAAAPYRQTRRILLSDFSLPESEYMESRLRSVERQGAHEAGGVPRGRARPPPSWTGGAPPDMDLPSSIFYIFQNNSLLILRSFRELLFMHKNNIMAILLKTASVRVSSIQIMQVRVQNKGKSVWKSRYDGDVSHSRQGSRRILATQVSPQSNVLDSGPHVSDSLINP